MKRHLQIDSVPSPIGDLDIVADADGRLCAAEFADHRDRLEKSLRLQFGKGRYELAAVRDPAGLSAAIAAYFAGDLDAIDSLPVASGGTPFQRSVWEALRRIPCGGTTSYRALAAVIGRPGAVRAVGHANGANPVSVVVPCHRVIGSGGGLTGYGGGLARKRWLLDHEAKSAKRR
jgi:methylated-DNA-[protein]-cysteine S-methyltransferase